MWRRQQQLLQQLWWISKIPSPPRWASIARTISSSSFLPSPPPPSFSSSSIEHYPSCNTIVSGQGQDASRNSSLHKAKTVECILNGADVPLSDTSMPSSSIFLKPQVVLYDGVCKLCNAGVRFVIKADVNKRISFCAVQSDAAEPYLLLCGLTREDVLERFLFVEGPGRFSQASTAALRLAVYLPFPYPLLSVLLAIPAPFRDAVYDYVAKRRYRWFGRTESCILPSEEILSRFIDREEIIAKLMKKEE